MDFIIGGAYQGKLDHAIKKYDLKENEIFVCTASAVDGSCDASGHCDWPEMDFSARCISGIEEFTYACVQRGLEPLDYFAEHEVQWKGCILICEDIFCGVVPLGADMREWRQATGRLCKYLSGKADSVSRIFCGLEQKLK